MKLNLRGKIVLPTLALFIATTALSVWYIQGRTADALKTSVLETIGNGLNTVTTGVDSMVDSIFRDLDGTGGLPQVAGLLGGGLPPESKKALESELLVVLGNRPFFRNNAYAYCSVLGPDGTTLISAGKGPGSGMAAPDAWKKAMSGQEAVGLPLVFDAAGRRMGTPTAKDPVKTLVVPFAVPVRRDGLVVGVVQAGVYFAAFSDAHIAPVKIGQEGHAFTAAGKGEILYHPSLAQVMTDTGPNSLTPRMVREKNGRLEYHWGGHDWMAIYKTSPKTNWTMIVKVREDEVFAPIRSIRLQALLINLAQLAVAGLCLLAISSRIVRSLRRTVAFAELVAAGDLNRELAVTGSDEVGVLANALRRMVGTLRDMIASSRAGAEEAKAQTERAEKAVRDAENSRREAEKSRSEGIQHAAGQLEALVETLNHHSATLRDRISQAASGADEQRTKTETGVAALARMNETVHSVGESAGKAKNSAEEARSLAESGSRAVAEVANSIQDVNSQAAALKGSLNDLGDRAEGISRIMNVISDIADQTNLLALNAAIEAARAGEAGRGFAVVADEVRKLAEKTMSATREVGESVRAIQGATRENIRMMDETAGTVDRTTSLAGDAGGALTAIVAAVRTNADHVAGIAAASVEQAATNRAITANMEDVDGITRSTAELMDRARQTLEEVTRTTAELYAQLQELKK